MNRSLSWPLSYHPAVLHSANEPLQQGTVSAVQRCCHPIATKNSHRACARVLLIHLFTKSAGKRNRHQKVPKNVYLRILEIPKLFNSGNTSFMISSRSPQHHVLFSLQLSALCCGMGAFRTNDYTQYQSVSLSTSTSPASRESLQPSHSQPMDLQVLPRVDGYLSWQGDASPALPPSPIHPPVT